MALPRPSRNAVGAVGAFLVAIFYGAARDFVWEDMRGGVLRTRGLSAPLRTVAYMSLLAIVALVCVLLFGDGLRQSTDLVAIGTGQVERGTLIPRPLVPLTVLALALGLSMILAGTLHMRWPMRVGGLLVHTAAVGGFGFGAIPAGVGGDTAKAVSFAFGATLAFAVWRWFARPRPATEFAVILALTGTSLVAAQQVLLQIDTDLGTTSFASTAINETITLLFTLALPLLFLLGFDLAELGERAAALGAGITFTRLGRVLPYVLLAALAGYRITVAGSGLLDRLSQGGAEVTRSLGGGALLVGLTAGAWWRFGSGRSGREPIRYHGVAEAARAVGVPLALMAFIDGLALMLWTGLNTAALTLRIPGVDVFTVDRSFEQLDAIVERADLLRGLLFLAAVVASPVLARRGHRAAAMFVVAASAAYLLDELSGADRPLASLGDDAVAAVDLWATLAVTVVGVVLLGRRRLDHHRALDVLFAFAVVEVMRHDSLLEDPFTAVTFGFGSFAVIVFGLLFDLLAVGGWANDDHPRSPRAGRLLAYLGYVLCSIAIVCWTVTSHDLGGATVLTGGAALYGFQILGRPLLLLLAVLALAEAWRGEPVIELEPAR